MKDKWRVGTRGSRLALIQTNIVISKLKALYPFDEFEIVPVSSKGDELSTLPLKDFKEDGIFVSEIENQLKKGNIDIAVHSLKDVPTTISDDFNLTVICERENPADVLISKNNQSLEDLKPGSVIGTSSPRRIAFINKIRSDLKFLPIRGNIETRIKKVGSEVDAVIIAAAAVNRLNLSSLVSEYFNDQEFLPAPGQGIICVEFLNNDFKYKNKLLNAVNNDVYREALAERAFMKAVGSSCSIPAGAHAVINGSTLTIKGAFSDVSAVKTVAGTADLCEDLGFELGRALLRLQG